eukprot:sb/3471979/
MSTVSDAESFNSSYGLIASQKRKKVKKPQNYNTLSAGPDNLTFVKAPLSYVNGSDEYLRDVQYDYLWKFTCVGDCGVGKSSVLNLYKDAYYDPEFTLPTPGLGLVETRADLLSKRVVLESEALALQEQLELEKYMECAVFDGTGATDRSRVVHIFSGISTPYMTWANCEAKNIP